MSPAVAAALGVGNARSEPRNAQLDALFEARRADNGADWSEHARKNSGFDFVFAPHKSISLAAEFAPTEAERQIIRNAIHAASDEALRYAAEDLGRARKGHAGEKGAERGEIGWVTFAHDAARPTLAVQNGPDGATYLMDAPIAGDPHYHLHNFIPNLVVTDDGRIGSIDSKVLTAHKVHEYGAIFQARLADRLRALGVRVGLDADGEAIVALDIPASAVATFSKRDRQVIGDAKAYAKDNAMDWDELSLERKKQLLHEASAAGRLGKTKDEARSVWREQAEAIGWSPKTVLAAAATPAREAADRHEKAYALAAEALSAEFQTAAVLDVERLRVLAARGLIEAGATSGRDDVDAVVSLFEKRGFVHDGNSVALIFGTHEGKARFSHAEQLRIEREVAARSRAAARDRSGDLSDRAIRAAITNVEAGDAGVRFSNEQRAAIHALGAGGRLSLLTGVAGSGKTTLLKPLVEAWAADGRTVVGMSTAWRQADALKDAGIAETWALQPLLNAIDTGEFKPDAKTVLIVDEISQIAPRPMLRLLEQQAETGMTIKMLGDREQVQSIEAGDTIALLKRVLPKTALPEVLTAVRQGSDRDRRIASLFRDGEAAAAFAMKREDGTARLLEGDTDQVVRQIADLYIERDDALKAQDPSYGVTLTTLTNAEAADISRAIRERLKTRGEIGADEATYKAVVYRGDKPEFFDLPIATGDKLRMYRKTVAQIDGRARHDRKQRRYRRSDGQDGRGPRSSQRAGTDGRDRLEAPHRSQDRAASPRLRSRLHRRRRPGHEHQGRAHQRSAPWNRRHDRLQDLYRRKPRHRPDPHPHRQGGGPRRRPALPGARRRHPDDRKRSLATRRQGRLRQALQGAGARPRTQSHPSPRPRRRKRACLAPEDRDRRPGEPGYRPSN